MVRLASAVSAVYMYRLDDESTLKSGAPQDPSSGLSWMIVYEWARIRFGTSVLVYRVAPFSFPILSENRRMVMKTNRFS